jgi:hypothetical protein
MLKRALQRQVAAYGRVRKKQESPPLLDSAGLKKNRYFLMKSG